MKQETKKAQKSHSVDLEGYLIPYRDDNPFVVQYDDSEDIFVPVFSSMSILDDHMHQIALLEDRIIEYKLNTIGDHSEFLASVWEQGFRVIIDPVQTSSGVKWKEIINPEDQDC